MQQQENVSWQPGQAGQVSRHTVTVSNAAASRGGVCILRSAAATPAAPSTPISTVTCIEVVRVLCFSRGRAAAGLKQNGCEEGRGCHLNVGVAGVLQFRLQMFDRQHTLERWG
jgi:hypothetical protein